MSFIKRCDHCRQRLRIPDNKIGVRVRCPVCSGMVDTMPNHIFEGQPPANENKIDHEAKESEAKPPNSTSPPPSETSIPLPDWMVDTMPNHIVEGQPPANENKQLASPGPFGSTADELVVSSAQARPTNPGNSQFDRPRRPPNLTYYCSQRALLWGIGIGIASFLLASRRTEFGQAGPFIGGIVAFFLVAVFHDLLRETFQVEVTCPICTGWRTYTGYSGFEQDGFWVFWRHVQDWACFCPKSGFQHLAGPIPGNIEDLAANKPFQRRYFLVCHCKKCHDKFTHARGCQ